MAAHGAVSAQTAAAMAAGVREALGADAAVAVTGSQAPAEAPAEKPVGLVFLHALTPEAAEAVALRLPGDREAVRSRAATSAFHLLRRVLTQSVTLSSASAR